MALPVLDGNQSATTLSSVVTGGEHIVAHTVVSLGSTAISNITSAVSGSVVSVSNFPATQTIAGTVTANLPYSSTNPLGVTFWNDANQLVGSDVPLLIGSAVTVAGNRENVFLNVTSQGSPIISGTVTVSNFPLGEFDGVAIQITDDEGAALGMGGNSLVVGGLDQDGYKRTLLLDSTGKAIISSVTIGNSVTIASLPAISGTVTANVGSNVAQETISGSSEVQPMAAVNIGWRSEELFHGVGIDSGGLPLPTRIYLDGNSGSEVGSNNPLPVSGTVTVGAMPNGSLTTRFGTPTTANTAFATSAVTNASRKYLLIQNVTTGSNVITVGIGFTPTTTQGIQLTAGAGITFESSYIPTGAVMILSSVTASNFTVLEA